MSQPPRQRLSDKPAHAPLDVADIRTLALTIQELTDERLDAFLRGQEALVATDTAARAEGLAHDERITRAEAAALQASGLDRKAWDEVATVTRAFYTSRHAVQVLERKMERLRAAGGALEELAALGVDRERLQAMTPLRQRYGEATLSRLLAREAALLRLHEQVTRLLTGR